MPPTITGEIKTCVSMNWEMSICKALPLTELPEERMQFTLGMYGEGDFFSMKGVVEEFFDKVGLTGKKTYDPMEIILTFIRDARQISIMTERGWDIWERYTRMWRTLWHWNKSVYRSDRHAGSDRPCFL